MFSRFYRLPTLGLPFCARLGERKYRSAARMIFFCPTSPQGRLAANNETIQDLCRLKAEKLICCKQKSAAPFYIGLHFSLFLFCIVRLTF